MNGTAVYGEPVVIIEVEQGNVKARTGRIVSDASSHAPVDNRYRTVICRDEKPSKKAHADPVEKEVSVSNIHLLKTPEAAALRDANKASEWFGGIYEDWAVKKIQQALKRLKL